MRTALKRLAIVIALSAGVACAAEQISLQQASDSAQELRWDKTERPNIVFVMIDDLGAEQIGAYGGETYPTPNIDKLAAQGMLFDNAFSQPMCQISRATVMSGQYGFRNGFPRNNDVPLSSKEGWGKGQPSVANLLQDAGYTTAMSGKWHLAHFDHHPDHLTEQGFEYQNSWAHLIGGKRTRRYWESTYYREKEFHTDGPGIYGPDEFCRYVTDFMAAHKDDEQPFFMYYQMVLVHFPYPQTPDNLNEPQPGWTPADNLRIAENKKWSEKNYALMVEYTDKLIGRVARLGLVDDDGRVLLDPSQGRLQTAQPVHDPEEGHRAEDHEHQRLEGVDPRGATQAPVGDVGHHHQAYGEATGPLRDAAAADASCAAADADPPGRIVAAPATAPVPRNARRLICGLSSADFSAMAGDSAVATAMDAASKVLVSNDLVFIFNSFRRVIYQYLYSDLV